jgi:hypothetical protein
MNFFGIEAVVDNEYKLYDIRGGNIFFILKEKNGKYYTSQLFEYDTIVEELKDWLISIISKGYKRLEIEELSFSYDKVIKPMFRDNKLKQLGIT